MSITVWRITKPRRVSTAFDGEGARLFGGRWNSPGVRAVYTSGTAALALLEILVHAPVLPHYGLVPATFDESLIDTSITFSSLPANWNTSPAPTSLAAIGDHWVAAAKTLALRVPSAVIPSEWNYILNPAHAHFKSVRIGALIPLPVDPRLL